MNTKNGPRHVVVDGSNIATEGRSLPSLAQLSEAVASFMEEHPDTTITVVVDATFGHRIDKREAAEFEAGISNNELVAPPAGAIGRGDAFVLSIAQKAGASILSNDSFQEFHADYDWLFDEGRLIGGKPVPHVGWVFVNRSPVRGPVSRKAIQGAKLRGGTKRGARKAVGSGSPLANEPMPVPKTPPPRRAASGAESAGAAERAAVPAAGASAPRAGEVVNELMPFLEFVEHHPIGTSVNGIVDAYSSHGAYISIGTDGVRGYIPLRLMSDPPPPSARKVMQIGEAVTVVVVSFAAARRSIDCAMPDMAARAPVDTDPLATEPTDQPRSSRRGRGRKAAAAPVEQPGEQILPAVPDTEPVAPELAVPAEVSPGEAPVQKRASRRTSAKKSAAVTTTPTTAEQAVAEPAVRKTTADKVPARKSAAGKAPAKKAAPVKRAPAKKAGATQASATIAPAPPERPTAAPATSDPAPSGPGLTAPTKTAPAKPAPGRPAPGRPAPAKPVPAKRAAGKKAPAKTTAGQKAPAKKSAAGTAPATTVPAKKAAAKKSVAKKGAAKKSTAKAAPRKSPAAVTTPATESAGAN